MSRNKPLSNEEKGRKLLEVFHGGQEFYQIKELEKLAKEKGIVQKQVSETLKRLVDEGLVSSRKMGPSNFYWSFPENVVTAKGQQTDEMKAKKNTLENKLVTLEAALKSKQVNKNDPLNLISLENLSNPRTHAGNTK
jgi:transcription initiation factor IIE alpha subunit